MSSRSAATGRHLRKGEQLTGYLFLAPALLILVGILFLPTVFNLIISLYDWSLTADTQKFVGLDNFRYMFSDQTTLNSIWLTFKFTVIAVFLEITLGLVLALILNSSLPGIRFSGFCAWCRLCYRKWLQPSVGTSCTMLSSGCSTPCFRSWG